MICTFCRTCLVRKLVVHYDNAIRLSLVVKDVVRQSHELLTIVAIILMECIMRTLP